ncbi:uncharacterized protein LOC128999200 [Macrosteles quadrilineatus]|uniref:uncharacterized protein LOC128999200 n=1 Tax=Macrosteles quadrilineatus TaxID=74068 RepID=UPI0023E1003E|nr:uncharacterized protein LOC128999200 [Macrosteles quadrilineatus]
MSGLQGGTLAGFRDQDNMGIQNESQNQGLISGLQRGVLAGLRDLDNMGVKLCKQDFNGTIRQIVAMEAIKNMPLFKQVKESDMRKIMNDSVRSRRVFKAARALIADDEEIAPRVVGATLMGAAQLAADFVKMMLTRY